jgi:hypothetical protein
MIRRLAGGYIDARTHAVLGGRSPAQTGSRCLADPEGAGQMYCRSVRTA